MSTNTREVQELLRLFKCVVATGTDVLTAFAKYKLLPTYNGNFQLFLDDKKHEIFHLWQSQKLLCCACPTSGCNLKRMSRMDNWIFKKIYDDNGLENNRKIVQVCLHKYIKRNIAIHELDISVISFLLRNLANLSQNENTALDIITTKRSQICHAHSMNCIPLTVLNTTWTELENALVDLTDPSYKGIIRNQTKYLRKVNLEKEEITELLKNFEEVNYKEIYAGKKKNNLDSLECPVLWQIATPKHWNLEATLRNPSNNDEQFKKKFVRKGSLIMLTTIAKSVLSDPDAFEAAVISFLTKMIEDCDINTEIPGRVDVRLHILNTNEEAIEIQAVEQSVEIVYTHEQVRDAVTLLRQRQPDDMEIQAVKQSLEMGYTQEQVRDALTLLRQIKPDHHHFSLNEILNALTKRTARKTVTQNDSGENNWVTVEKDDSGEWNEQERSKHKQNKNKCKMS
ncbi:unnamed protein product [Mytilus coruscus]|uniref:UBA domain-containing protein n=1 Tax=Mytilus coruscus TaxID=42192 RepID=A0A6J8EBJ5_MYTCO|nr:unnamed protein product [Mytilus coruscus]